MSRQQLRDALLVLTVTGVLLLMPPILPFFDRPGLAFGLPPVVVYVFGVWIALILLGRLLSSRMPEDAPAEPAGDAGTSRPEA